jgi:hypothetical protein
MKMRILIFGLTGIILSVLVSCNKCTRTKDENLAPNAHKVEVAEVIQGSSYTYARVSDNDKEYWVAIDKADIKEGKTYYWSKGGEMTEFTSRELKRTFRSIYFIEDFTEQPITADKAKKPIKLTSMAGRQQPEEEAGISVPRAEGGLTIAEVYAKKSTLAGKTVRIRGKVVKFAADIMKKNWVHIQDGTKDGDNYDLALTTMEAVTVGDVAMFEGVVAVDKNIGAGYVYSILVENAKLIK